MLLRFQEYSKHKQFIVEPSLINHLLAGGILLAPTDTVFGIISLDEKKIRNIKKKPSNAPLQLLATKEIALNTLAKKVTDNGVFQLLAENFWPGPLSIIAETDSGHRDCFRVPDNNFLLSLLSQLNKPIFASSLNLHGEAELWDKDKIKQLAIDSESDVWVIFEKKVINTASTIIDFDTGRPEAASVKFLRLGSLTLEQLKEPLLQANYKITRDKVTPDMFFVANSVS